MSDFSLTLVLQIKTSKIINDMAKVSKKSEKITAFGGIFFVLDKFDHILSSVIDSHLGLRSKSNLLFLGYNLVSSEGWAHQCLPLLECMVYFMESVHYIYRFGRYLYLFGR